MAQIPAHVTTLLSLPQEAEEEQIRISVEGLDSSKFDELLTSPESRECFIACILNPETLKNIDEYPLSAEFVGNQQMWTISLDGSEFAHVLAFPSNDEDLSLPPPGALEKWIFHLFLNGHFLALDRWRSSLQGKGVTFKHAGVAATDEQASLSETLTLGILERSTPTNVSPLIASQGADLTTVKRASKAAYQLLAESLREANPKWRFLSFYRAIEHVYIESVLNQLNDAFFDHPKDAVEIASKALAAEVEQLRVVVEKYRLTDQFDEFADEFEACANRGEQLAIAIQRQIANKSKDAGDKQRPPKWSIGVRYCYQVRCAIAHAGQATAFVEKYSDWRKTVERLCPILERAALQLFGTQLL